MFFLKKTNVTVTNSTTKTYQFQKHVYGIFIDASKFFEKVVFHFKGNRKTFLKRVPSNKSFIKIREADIVNHQSFNADGNCIVSIGKFQLRSYCLYFA